MHNYVKYESFKSNGLKVIGKVKVLCHRQTDRAKTICPLITDCGGIKMLFTEGWWIEVSIISSALVKQQAFKPFSGTLEGKWTDN